MRLAHVQLDAIFGSPAANRKTVTNHIALRLVRLQGLVGRICHFNISFGCAADLWTEFGRAMHVCQLVPG
jgi:hypothetical protein